MHLRRSLHPCHFRATTRFAAIVAGLIALASSTASCDEKPKPASQEAPPVQLPHGVTMERDVPYVPDGDDSQKLDLYLPKTPAGRPLPLIVHIHGGGWRGGSKFPCPFVGMVAQGYVVASLEGNKAKTDAVSPVHYVSKDSPPMLILHGTHDALVPFAQSEQFAAALKEQGVAVWLQALPGSGHGGPVFGKPSILGLMKTFFDRHLKGADVTIDLVPPEAVAVEPPASEAK